MPRLEYFLVCRDVSVDRDTNEITLFRVIEEALIRNDAPTLRKVMVVSAWNLDAEEANTDYQIQLKIFLPGEEKGKDFRMNISKSHMRFRAVQGITGIPLEKEGDLRFVVYLNDEDQASHTIRIRHAEPIEVKSYPGKKM